MPTIMPIPPPAPESFTQEAMAAALPHARRLAMMLYAATELLPGDAPLASHAADALACVNAALAIDQEGEALAAAARAAGEVA
jgi:hypothetical protein